MWLGAIRILVLFSTPAVCMINSSGFSDHHQQIFCASKNGVSNECIDVAPIGSLKIWYLFNVFMQNIIPMYQQSL